MASSAGVPSDDHGLLGPAAGRRQRNWNRPSPGGSTRAGPRNRVFSFLFGQRRAGLNRIMSKKPPARRCAVPMPAVLLSQRPQYPPGLQIKVNVDGGGDEGELTDFLPQATQRAFRPRAHHPSRPPSRLPSYRAGLPTPVKSWGE